MRLAWDKQSYEVGVDHGVIYPSTEHGIAWNGLLSVVENPSSDASGYFLDGVKYKNQSTIESFDITINSVTYPEILDENTQLVGLSYRTTKDNRYQIHLVYNPILSMSNKVNETIGNDPTIVTFGWDVTTKPVTISGYAPTSQLILDLTEVEPQFVEHFESRLYGSTNSTVNFPTPRHIISLAKELITYGAFIVLNHGDGTWTAIGPESMISMIDDTTFSINSQSAAIIDSDTYTLNSL